MVNQKEKEFQKVSSIAGLNYGACPACDRYKLQVVLTMKPIRKLRCTNCEKIFETIEIFTVQLDDSALEPGMLRAEKGPDGAATCLSGGCSSKG